MDVFGAHHMEKLLNEFFVLPASAGSAARNNHFLEMVDASAVASWKDDSVTKTAFITAVQVASKVLISFYIFPRVYSAVSTVFFCAGGAI